MADGIKVTFDGFDKMKSDLQKLKQNLQQQADFILNKGAQKIATKAKQYAPVDEGILRNSISADTSKPLNKIISANSPYAAFMEFGTGLFAAEYVASLPSDWQEFAAKFKGQKGSGTFYDFVLIIKEWIRRHPEVLTGSQQEFNEESGLVITRKPRRRSRDEKEAELDRAAYFIARKIILKGVKAQPYLYPAFKEVIPEIIEQFKKLFGK